MIKILILHDKMCIASKGPSGILLLLGPLLKCTKMQFKSCNWAGVHGINFYHETLNFSQYSFYPSQHQGSKFKFALPYISKRSWVVVNITFFIHISRRFYIICQFQCVFQTWKFIYDFPRFPGWFRTLCEHVRSLQWDDTL
jgi:hypothetical protein